MKKRDISEISVQFVKGIGPKNSQYLEKLNVFTVEDLFYRFPFRSEDRKTPLSVKKILSMALIPELCFMTGTIQKIISSKSPRRRAQILTVVVEDHEKSGQFNLLFFKQRIKYALKFLEVGKKIAVWGNINLTPSGIFFSNFDFEILKNGTLSFFRIVPVYKTSKNINLSIYRRWIFNALESYSRNAVEFIPNSVLREFAFMRRDEAFKKVHFPETFEEQAKAYKRLKFEDFFIYECAVAYNHFSFKKTKKPRKYTLKKNILTPWRKNLPFEFTEGQKKAILEIFNDLLSPYPMHRLLQGDVGSGKTVVALSAALLIKENGFQTAFLAPTLNLAWQHYETMKKLLKGLPVNIGILVGGMKAKEKKEMIKKIKEGQVDIVIGTHAIFEESVKFKNLALIIIDEQQRFGLYQKAILTQKAISPDILVMTATPIPRALAMTLFGDLEKTEIRELPSGRKPVETIQLSSDEAYERVRKEIEKGHQAYIVYPVIENEDEKNVTTAYKLFSQEIFPDFRIGLLHGKLSPAEKKKVLDDFSKRRIQILVSTTVVEVGIDVPNATIMIIEGAENFGLSTLHQLRGRIGRGSAKSTCIVTVETADARALKRISYFLKCNDGFELAEKDLILRGAGQYFGTEQHGRMDVKFSYNLTLEAMFQDEISDLKLLRLARNVAFKILKNDPSLKFAPEIKKRIFKRFASGFHLAKIS
ncbi:MAG: ATP-dependent DNA helicase RecG [Elusimicrobia bacterium]|nr:ATP-dependent DNA helicase RecG [Elusimicrobiota bacterium]